VRTTVKAHRCPPWCHDCPDMRDAALSGWANGDESKLTEDDRLMPGCWGGAVGSGCHCSTGPASPERPKPSVRIELTRPQWRSLESRANAEHMDVSKLAARLLGDLLRPPRRDPKSGVVPPKEKP